MARSSLLTPRALLLIFCGLALSAATARAQEEGEYRSVTSGFWGSTSTWEIFQGGAWVAIPPVSDGGSPPNEETTQLVTIRSGHSVQFPQDRTERLGGDLTIAGGGELAASLGGGLLFRGSTLTNLGTIENGVNLYFGGSAQTIAGSGVWKTASIHIGTEEPSSTEVRLENDIEIAPNQGGVTIRSGADLLLDGNTLRFSADHSVVLRGVAVLDGGLLETNGTVTLLGSANLFDADLQVVAGLTRSHMIHTGSITVDAGATLGSNDAEARGNVVINGTLAQASTGTFQYFAFSGPNLVNNGVIADVELQMAGSGQQNLDGSGEWRPRRLRIMGSSSTHIVRDLSFDSYVRLEEGGVLDLAAHTFTHVGGADSGSPNVLNNFGSITGQGRLVTNGWVLQHSPGPLGVPLLIESGNTRTSAGPVNYGAAVTVAPGAELEINTNSGTAAVVAGPLTNDGTLRIADTHSLIAQDDVTVGSGGVMTGDQTGSLFMRGETLTISNTDVEIQSVYFQGTAAQFISGSGSFWNLVLDNAAGLSLGGDLDVGGELRLSSGDLFLGSYTVDLGSGGFLREVQTAERANRAFGSFGVITATRNLDGAVSGMDFAGLGARITSPKTLGLTTIARGHSAEIPNGIARYYDISVENNQDLGAGLTLAYHEAEMSGVQESDRLKLYREGEDGWERMEESIASSTDDDQPVRSVGLSGIDHFSRWTIGGPHLRTRTRANLPNTGESGDPVSTFTGELFFTEDDDFDLGGPLPLVFRRYYASLLEENGMPKAGLGPNWSHTFNWRLLRVDEDNVEVVTWRGRRIPFATSGDSWQQVGILSTSYQLVEEGTGFVFADSRTHRMYIFDSQGRLVRLEDRWGNGHEITHSGGRVVEVSDGLGRTLSFSYDQSGHLTEVSDGARDMVFGYDGDLLVEATDALGETTTYLYDEAHPRAGLLTTRTLPRGNAPFTQTFDPFGRVATQSDAAGNIWTFSYASDRGTITDPLGHALRHTYDDAGRLITITDQLGSETTYTYDDKGRRVGVTNREGESTSFTYHEPSGQRSSVALPDGATVRVDFAPLTIRGITFYEPIRYTYPDGSTQHYEYDGTGNLVSVTDRAGHVWRYAYNARGQVTSETNPAGGVTTQVYNDDGTRSQRTHALGTTTGYGYDALRRLTTVTHPDGSIRSLVYDLRDQLIEITDEAGNSATYSYDANGNVVALSTASGAVSTVTYDGNDRAIEFGDPSGSTMAVEYDARGQIGAVTDRTGKTTALQYDARGFRTQITDAEGQVWSYERDGEGRMIARTNPLGQSTTFSYDERDRLNTVTSALGATSTFEHGPDGRLQAVADPLARTTTVSHTSRGFLRRINLPGAADVSYSTNALGLVDRIEDANGGFWERTHDAAGLLQTHTDPLGRQTNYTYDERGRVAAVTLPNGTRVDLVRNSRGYVTEERYGDDLALVFTYDADGRMAKAGSVEATYDAKGALVAVNGFSAERDGEGRLTTLTYPGGQTVRYSYDGRGLLTEVRDWAGGITTFEYDGAGRPLVLRRPNGATTTKTYDADGRVVRIEVTGGQADAGSGTEGGGGSASEGGGAGGATENEGAANVTDGRAEVLAYHQLERDAVGNVTRATRFGPAAPQLDRSDATFSIDAGMQIAGFDYDALGRLVRDSLRTYYWDDASRLTGYDEGLLEVRFTYDALGARLTRSEGDQQRTYAWNYLLSRPSLAAETRQTGVSRYFVHTPSGALLHRIDADSTRHFFHFDERGNTTIVTGEEGQVEAAYAYTPYGQVVGSMGEIDNAFTFAGRYGAIQEGDLYQMYHRFYDSRSRRFLSPDPARHLAINQFDPATLNPYQYAFLNPMAYVDPLGSRPRPADGDGESDGIGASIPGMVSFAAWAGVPHLKGVLDDLLKAARMHRQGGRIQEAARALSQYDDLAKKAKWLEAAGHVATLASAGIAIHELRGRIQELNNEAAELRAQARESARRQRNRAITSQKRGNISRRTRQERIRQANRTVNERLDEIEAMRSRLVQLEIFRGTLKTAESVLPNPTAVSLVDDVFGPLGALIFGE